jgi:hypothetical protein
MNNDFKDFIKIVLGFILLNIVLYGILTYKLEKLNIKHETSIKRTSRAN